MKKFDKKTIFATVFVIGIDALLVVLPILVNL